MDSTIGGETRLADRAVQAEKRRDRVLRTIRGCRSDLWVGGRAGAPDGWLSMATRTAVEIETWSEAERHVFDFFKCAESYLEEFRRRVVQPGDRTAGSCRTTAQARVMRHHGRRERILCGRI